MSDKITVNDNFGSNQILKDLLPGSHIIDIRVRANGKYYWFEGNFLKQIIGHVDFELVDNGLNATLEQHAEIKPC